MHEMQTVGDLICYGKEHNYLKALKKQPGLGEDHGGVILVYKGKYLDENNNWVHLPHAMPDDGIEAIVLPPCVDNLVARLRDATAGCRTSTALAQLNSCVRECLRDTACVTSFLFFVSSPICQSPMLLFGQCSDHGLCSLQVMS